MKITLVITVKDLLEYGVLEGKPISKYNAVQAMLKINYPEYHKRVLGIREEMLHEIHSKACNNQKEKLNG